MVNREERKDFAEKTALKKWVYCCCYIRLGEEADQANYTQRKIWVGQFQQCLKGG